MRSIGALLLIISCAVFADDASQTYDRISLSVSSSRGVANDTLVALLNAQQEGSDAAALSREVNSLIAWAVNKSKATKGVAVQTLNYRTNPIYRKQTLTGWRVSQAVRLESQDVAALSELLGTLQERLGLNSIAYNVSPHQRKRVEDELIAEALNAFQQRARLVTDQFQRPTFRVVQLNINTSESHYRPPMARSMAMDADAGLAPTLEAGTQRVQVSVNGTIELGVK